MKFRPFAIGAMLGGLALPVPAYAADGKVTYYEDVAPIMLANCASCHKPAGQNIGSLVAPMSLQTYEETRPWARAIARRVKAKEMPPWFADGPKGVFSNERGLTEEQIQTIVAWVEAGAPAGDKAKAPPIPQSVEAQSGGYTLGKPDFIVKMSERFWVSDDSQDLQANFPTKIPEEFLPADTTVRAWEFRAGTYLAGQDTVHHMCGTVRPPGTAAEHDADAETEAPGVSLGCIAGGAEPNMLPEGFGLTIPKGSSVTYSMHYYKQKGPGTGYWNQPEIGFYLAKGPIKYKVNDRTLVVTEFEMPPHSKGYKVGAGQVMKKDTLIMSYWPHAHLRAYSARFTATYPDGRKEVLLDVPRYDQGWQVTYKYNRPKLLPKGTLLETEWLYDNTADRGAKHKFDANKTVRYGLRTQDEMSSGHFSYVELEPGQEVPAIAQQQQ